MENKVAIEFQKTVSHNLEIDFKKVYDFVKADCKNDGIEDPDKWDVNDYFGNNIEYFIKEIYNYEIENNDWNEGAMDILFDNWQEWIDNLSIDEE